MSVYPISFSIPECKIVKEVPEKTKELATIIPGDQSTYIFNSEDAYYADYQTSKYGKTVCKGGWDCLRHYEILANGCIPWFPDLENCPPQTMVHFPKKAILRTNPRSLTDNQYPDAVRGLLDYTRTHLTTKAMAQYVLNTAGHPNAKKILYLSGLSDWAMYTDYLRCLTLHGFKELLHAECYDYPRINHLYTNYAGDANQLYGKGMTYSKLLPPEWHTPLGNVEQSIANKEFDVVIYGSIHRGMPFFDKVSKVYAPNEIILLCGEDLHGPYHKHGACPFIGKTQCNLFVREL